MRQWRSLVALTVGAVIAAGAPLAKAADDRSDRATWVGTWATVPTAVPASGVTTLADATVRQIVHVSVGGEAVRVRLSNEFGERPLRIGEAHVARRASGTDIMPGTDRRLTFGGRASISVPAGSPMLSDPVGLRVPDRSDLVVSIYLPVATPVTTVHAFPFQDNVIADGNVSGARSVQARQTVGQWYFLSGVSVRSRERGAAAIVALGDSITDGANTGVNANHRWPDLLANRLAGERGPTRGVLNLGIAGNRLLHDPNPPPGSPAEGFAAYFGQSALRRYDRDVGSQPGARYLVVLLGVNDLGHPGTVAPPSEVVSAEDIIGAHRQLIARAHAAGLRVLGGTILPFKDDTLGFYNAGNEAKRQAVNRWIRAGGEYDGVVDFDAALRDPADPLRLAARYDSGDHLHPNDAGMAAMAAAVPLRLLR